MQLQSILCRCKSTGTSMTNINNSTYNKL